MFVNNMPAMPNVIGLGKKELLFMLVVPISWFGPLSCAEY
jgi:hypothetical protein